MNNNSDDSFDNYPTEELVSTDSTEPPYFPPEGIIEELVSDNGLDESSQSDFISIVSIPNLLDSLNKFTFTRPTPVQEQALPLALQGRDLLIEAETGSGKTLTFVIPLIAHLKQSVTDRSTVGLIITPTRELAQQVYQVIQQLVPKENPTLVVGGVRSREQFSSLNKGSRVIVGTPGRILDLVRGRKIDLRNCSFFALDEADEMLSMGFLEDVQAIIRNLPKNRQGILVSATLNPRVEILASHVLSRPETITVAREIRQNIDLKVDHMYVNVGSGLMDKGRCLVNVIEKYRPRSAIVFCNTKSDTELVEAILKRQGFDAERLNSDLHQQDRFNVMSKLKGERLNLLIATDIAARGIDADIDLVINYSLPELPESYVHRTGRTGRAGRSGRALTIIAPMDIPKFHNIRKSLDFDFAEVEI
jgi:ATP-dependent RNA helicase DeaD